MASLEITKLTIAEDSHTLVNLLKEYTKSITITSSLALVGQSGSGKSLTLKTILGMVPKNLNANFQYTSDFELSKENIGFIPQNPFTSLSPMTKINKQFFDENYNYFSKKKIDELFVMVGLEPELQNKFPVELSGGQLQRIVIAIALSKNPKMLLLDEPTTALDDLSKKNILDLITSLQKKLGFLILFVSHDIESIKNICQNIAIIQNGSICEYGDIKQVLQSPKHPYTTELIESNFENRKFRI
jgi:peptide/nickel transport system ATP-binding protein